MRRLAQNLLLSLCAVLLCAALVEAFFRVLDRGQAGPSPDATGPTSRALPFQRLSPLLGYDGLPGVRGRFHGATVTHNSLATAAPRPRWQAAGVRRTVFRANSQPLGYGVGDARRIPASSPRLLNEAAAPPRS